MRNARTFAFPIALAAVLASGQGPALGQAPGAAGTGDLTDLIESLDAAGAKEAANALRELLAPPPDPNPITPPTPINPFAQKVSEVRAFKWSSGPHNWAVAGAGPVVGPDAQPRLAARTLLAEPGAPWMRARLREYNLGSASYLVITSLLDGGQQRHTHKSLEGWYGYTAFFNGDRVQIELHVAPGDEGVFVEFDEVVYGIQGGDQPPESLCGADNRVASTDSRAGRIATPNGSRFCTAWLASNGALLTAGHCVDFDTGAGGDGTFDLPAGTIIEFNPPASLANGTNVASAPQDQYPINVSNPQFDFTAIGQDWAVLTLNNNATTGAHPHVARGFFRMTRESPAVNNTMRITGCGNDTTPPGSTGGGNAQNRTLQTDTGPYVGEFSNAARFWHRYAVDTEGNNSGSPIIWNSNGLTIGIHTNAGCTSTGGSNQGCSFEHDPLEVALRNFISSAARFVDVGHPLRVAEEGTVYRPYSTVALGVSGVPSGGVLSIVEGNYTAAAGNTFTAGADGKSFLMRAPVGTVVIGN